MPDLEYRGKPLLHDWTDANQLVLAIGNEPTSRNGDVIRIDPAGLAEEGREILGTDDKLIIVRPDGYVAFRGTTDQNEHWGYFFAPAVPPGM